METHDLPVPIEAKAAPIQRADRVLVWLVWLTLVLGGLATVAVAFSAEAVLARLNAVGQDQPAADEHDDAHDTGGDVPGHDMGGMRHDASPTAGMPGHDMGGVQHDATPTVTPITAP